VDPTQLLYLVTAALPSHVSPVSDSL